MATDTSAGVAYIDGEFIPIGEASVPILDLGFLRSDATYDVVAVWKGKFFRLDKHLDRFFAGLEKLRLELPVDRDGLTRVLAIELLTAARALDFRAPLNPAPATAAVLALLRGHVAGPGPDRYLSPEIEAAHVLVVDGSVLAAAESALRQERVAG